MSIAAAAIGVCASPCRRYDRLRPNPFSVTAVQHRPQQQRQQPNQGRHERAGSVAAAPGPEQQPPTRLVGRRPRHLLQPRWGALLLPAGRAVSSREGRMHAPGALGAACGACSSQVCGPAGCCQLQPRRRRNARVCNTFVRACFAPLHTAPLTPRHLDNTGLQGSIGPETINTWLALPCTITAAGSPFIGEHCGRFQAPLGRSCNRCLCNMSPGSRSLACRRKATHRHHHLRPVPAAIYTCRCYPAHGAMPRPA